MKSKMIKYKSVDEYIAQFPESGQGIVKQVRATIYKSAPKASEGISYGMPAYKLNNKPLAYFAFYPNHLGFYATPNGHKMFKEELTKYKQGKGSVQFPLDRPIPLTLISRMVKFNAQTSQKEELPKIGAPAERALAHVGIKKLKDFSKYTEEEIASLHGMGPKAISVLKKELKSKNLSFKK